ncbi:MAG: TonB-dependent receptor, partial [Terracidiphilus sp.]|nr:TonB-dependent receptor [Terracidiphilus sp.]
MMLLAGPTRRAACQSTNSGDIRGTVTDTTGALIPGAKVTILNVNTGVSKDFVTNAEGLYDTSSIVAGSYTVSFSKEGFQSLIRGPITLQVGVTTVNGQLKVGSNAEQVTVTSDVPLLLTESGEKSTTWDSHTLDAFPQVAGTGSQGQDWGNEVAFLPGFTGSASSDYGVAGMAQWGSANGSMPYNNVLQDGAAASTGGSMIATDTTLEAVAELQVSTSNFSAQYGSGGVVINQITKGGTNEFHGSAYDYIQNNAWNAASYGFGTQVPVNFIRYNNFGGSIGGPVIKKKMFFFFDYDQVVDHAAASNNFFSVPSSQVMGGDFGGAGVTSLLYDPTTQTIATDSQGNLYPQRQSFQSEYGCNCIPSQLVDSVSNAVQQYYPTQSSHISGSKFVNGTQNAVGVYQYNFFSSIPQSTPYVKYFGRLDYDVTPKNRISMSDTQNNTPVIYPSALTECPIGCEGGDVDANIAQITDVWNISPTFINEARFGFTFQGNWFNDFSLDKGYANKVGWQFAKVDDFP